MTQWVPVRRQDVDVSSSESRSSTPDAKAHARLHNRLHEIFGSSRHEQGQSNIGGDRQDIQKNNGGQDDRDGYEFRLFANRGQPLTVEEKPCSSQRIALRSPSPVDGVSGFLIPRKPDTFYFTSALDEIQALQYRRVAITGAEVLAGSKTKWRGAELPWRVTTIQAHQAPNNAMKIGSSEPVGSKSRKRHSKKRRIAIRKAYQRKEAKHTALKQAQVEKEMADRKKRTKRNREKKVKRKEKEKAKKSIDAKPADIEQLEEG